MDKNIAFLKTNRVLPIPKQNNLYDTEVEIDSQCTKTTEKAFLQLHESLLRRSCNQYILLPFHLTG